MPRSRKYHKRTRVGGQSYDAVKNQAYAYGEKAKNAISSGISSASNWFKSLTTTAPAPSTSSYPAPAPVPTPAYQSTAPAPAPALAYSPAMGGKRRRRFRTRKHKRGGSVVKAYNAYVDSSTMNATPVHGYRTAFPHNWVGGKTRTRTRRCR